MSDKHRTSAGEPIDPTLDAQFNWWNRSTGPTGWEVAHDLINVINPKVDVDNWLTSAPNCPKQDPVPQVCEVTSANLVAKLRIQPSLDDENWLLEVPDTYVYTGAAAVTGAALPARPWLWTGGSVPSSVTVSSIRAVASVGAIGWVDPDVIWIQVLMTTDAGVLTGYMEQTDVSGTEVLPLSSCSLGTLPIPTPDPGLPTVTLDTFAGVSPILPVFDSLQSPATMGSFGLHLGTNPSQSGATLDIELIQTIGLRRDDSAT